MPAGDLQDPRSLIFDHRVAAGLLVNYGKCPSGTIVFALSHSPELGQAKQLIKELLCLVISGNYVQI